MKPIKKYFCTVLFAISTLSIAQTNEINITGFVTDSKTGEVLIGTNILLYKDSISLDQQIFRGTATNSYGFFALPKIPPRKYFIVVRHLGYQSFVKEIQLKFNDSLVRLNVNLEAVGLELSEVLVTGKKESKPNTSTIDVPTELINKLPSLSGEVDLFKLLQYLPGVKAESEISSGLYIRGGPPDQTLTLVDGMIIYNPTHLGNFTSTFNSNALQHIRLIKGGMPAEYGGRLSSVLDIKLKSGTKEKDRGRIGIGMLSSNITLEGPMSENSTYMLSGRGMYYDFYQKTFDKNSIIPRYNFFDMNSKFTYSFSDNDVISISGMYSRDYLHNPPNSKDISYEINWKNGAVNINWLQASSKSFFSNTILSYINYQFSSVVQNDITISSYADYFASSKLEDFLLKKSLEFYWHQFHTFKAGVELSFHNYDLLATNIYNPLLEVQNSYRVDILSPEASIYLQNESQITSNIKANIGGRAYYLRKSNYLSFEPRISISYLISDNLQINSAFAVAHQFLHLITRNDISLPTDLWYPSTKNIKPSRSQQYVFGVEYFLNNQEYHFSVEGYYRDMQNLYEFKDNARFNLGNSIEDLLAQGTGEAYGLEIFINKQKGNFTGWVGYSLAWTKRKFDELNGGKIYYPKYDRRHDVSLVLTYDFNPQLSAGLTWIYATGQGFTMPLGQYQFIDPGLNNSPEIKLNHTERNGYKLPSYHKLDINVTYKFLFFDLPAEAYLNIFNVYNRKNSFAQYIVLEDSKNGSDNKALKLKQITLFPFIPTVGLNIAF